MTRQRPEEDFQAQVIELAERLGWSVYHTRRSKGSTPGFPDLVMIGPLLARPLVYWRRLLVAELKIKPATQAAGRATWAQAAWLYLFYEAGAEVRLWRPDDWPDIERTLR